MDTTELQSHRQATISFLQSNKLLACRVNPLSKAPGKDWQASNNTPEMTATTLNAIHRTEDNIGIHICDSVVDVDIDTRDKWMQAALDYFLPSSSHVWGRTHRERTHRLYQLKDEYDTLRRSPLVSMMKNRKSLKPYTVEFRGGQKESAQQSLMPGSVVETDGEKLYYRWADLDRVGYGLTSVLCDDLLSAVAHSAVVAAVAPHWVEGKRNDMVMALSGLLYNCQALIQPADDKQDAPEPDVDVARHILKGLLEVVGDNDSSRLQTFERTWNKALSGTPVTGGKRLNELTEESGLSSLIYMLLTGQDNLQEIEEFYDRFRILMNTDCVVDMDSMSSQGVNAIMRVSDFKFSYSHVFYKIGEKKIRPVNSIHTSMNSKRVASIDFNPAEGQLYDDPRFPFPVANMWRGFQHEKTDRPADDSIHLFLEYIHNVVANGDPLAADWLLDWLANLVQHPEHKPGTALVLVGKQGTGKSILGDVIVEGLVGRSHYLKGPSIRDFLSGHNGEVANKLFIQFDEAVSSYEKKSSELLKDVVTAKSLYINPKFKPAMNIDAYFRLLFTSNHDHIAVAIKSTDDRRFTILRVSDAKGENRAYWTEFRGWLARDNNIGKIYNWLCHREYQFENIMRPYVTGAKLRMAQGSMDIIDRWLVLSLERDHPLSDRTHRYNWSAFTGDRPEGESKDGMWPEKIHGAAILDEINEIRKNFGIREAHALQMQHIKKELADRGIEIEKIKSTVALVRENENEPKIKKCFYLWSMPSRDQIQASLTKRYGEDYSQMVELAREEEEKPKHDDAEF